MPSIERKPFWNFYALRVWLCNFLL